MCVYISPCTCIGLYLLIAQCCTHKSSQALNVNKVVQLSSVNTYMSTLWAQPCFKSREISWIAQHTVVSSNLLKNDTHSSQKGHGRYILTLQTLYIMVSSYLRKSHNSKNTLDIHPLRVELDTRMILKQIDKILTALDRN